MQLVHTTPGIITGLDDSMGNVKARIANYLTTALLAAASVGTVNPAMAQTRSSAVTNIVLVHGAWVDGSGWKPVYDILVKDGYAVTLVQEPLTSFAEDVAATRRVLSRQQGPCILVGHSYGGSVISEAGTDSHVVGLVYIAAHMPDAGESEAADGTRYPSVTSTAGVIEKSSDGFTHLDPAQFAKYFGADLPREKADFEAHSQIETAAAVFLGKVTQAAWRSKPSWMLVAAADLIINPDLERWYATRAPQPHRRSQGGEPLDLSIASERGRRDDRGCRAALARVNDLEEASIAEQGGGAGQPPA